MKKYTIKQIREERIAISKLTEEQFNKLVEAFQKKYPNDNYKHSYIKEAEQWRFYSNLCAPLDVVGRFTYVSYVSDIASSFIRASKLITFEEIDFEEFPEKWAVKNDIDKIVGKWFDENKQNSIQDYALKYTNKYFHYPAIREKEYILDNEYFHAFTEVQKGYTEITLEEFKKHILKEETMEEKKIIGYLAPYDLYEGKVKKGTLFIKSSYSALYYYTNNKEYVIPKEIVENWEPCYKTKEQVFNMGSFEVVVKDGKAFHKNDDITNFVKRLIETFYNKDMYIIDNYRATVEDITFSKTGCQNNQTKLSDWKKVYNALNQ